MGRRRGGWVTARVSKPPCCTLGTHFLVEHRRRGCRVLLWWSSHEWISLGWERVHGRGGIIFLSDGVPPVTCSVIHMEIQECLIKEGWGWWERKKNTIDSQKKLKITNIEIGLLNDALWVDIEYNRAA